MRRVSLYGVFVILLCSIGCSSDEHINKTAVVTSSQTPAPPPQSPAPAVAPVKPNPVPMEVPAPLGPRPVKVMMASSRINPAVTTKSRPPTTEPKEMDTPVDTRSETLAIELLRLPLEDRLKWKQQEFAKRGIPYVRDGN